LTANHHGHDRNWPISNRNNTSQVRLGALLAQLCVLTEADSDDIPEISRTGQFSFDQVDISVASDSEGSFLKVFADVCEIDHGMRLDIYRSLLMGQGLREVPFSVVPALHSQSERLLAFGFWEVSDTPEAPQELLAFVKTVVLARHSLLQAVNKMRR